MEGFICPKCRESFETADNLLAHFSKCTENETQNEDNNFILKDSFKNLESMVFREKYSQNSNSEDEIYIKNHTKNFETLRSIYNTDIRIFSNRTILRMRKILSISVEDLGFGKSAKNIEQEIVEWDMVSVNCNLCHCLFNFFRRRHHCRTCGCAICGNCMKILDIKGMSQI